MKNNLKKSMYFLFAMILMMTLAACGNIASENENNDNNESNEMNFGNLVEFVEELEESEESEEETEVSLASLTNVADYNGVIYTVLKSEVVEGEYETQEGYEAVKIDIVVENKTSEMSSINTTFECTLTGDSGEEYSAEAFVGGLKGDLVNPIGPGKILRGEILIFSKQEEQNFKMEIEDFFADNHAELTFAKGQSYDETLPVSSGDGKGYGDEIVWTDLLNFVVNSAEVVDDPERPYISIKLTEKNPGTELVDQYMIPFVLIDENGYDCDLDYRQDNYQFANVEGGEEREIELLFALDDTSVKSFDLYLQPFAEDALDIVHITVE